MSELTIREMGQDEDFSAWFSELLEQEDATTGLVHQLYVVERGQRLHIPPIVIDPQGKFAAALGSGQPLVLRDRAATESYGIRTAPGTVPADPAWTHSNMHGDVAAVFPLPHRRQIFALEAVSQAAPTTNTPSAPFAHACGSRLRPRRPTAVRR